ncbi:MAG: DHHA1 domain-containing protein [Phycisphaerae bacterium]|nr:DHHA1 domain-containing protein [Phycisphaerae bacterium]
MSVKHAGKVPAKVLRRVSAAQSLLVVTHARPDGDALGSMRALTLAARAAGKTAWMLMPDAVPTRYAFLFADETPAPAGRFAELAAKAEAVVILDTSVFGQLDGLDKAIPPVAEKLLVIDHHATPGELGGLLWNDPSAAACGVLMRELIEAMRWPQDAAVCEALWTAIVSDTGWFHYPNTDARSLHHAAALLEAGVQASALYDRLLRNDRPERLKLVARMLGSLEMHCGGLLAVMTIRKADFDASGTRPDETENLINEALRIGSVEAVILLTELDGLCRVSLRSRTRLDVAQIAKSLGGGGHTRAAGVRISGSLEAVKPRVLAALTEALGRLGGSPR